MSTEKSKMSKEFFEDLRTKIVEKHGQSQGSKSIPRVLAVPVSTVCNVVKMFTAHDAVR